MTKKTRRVPISVVSPGEGLAERFVEMERAAIDAASPFLNKEKAKFFSLNPDYFYYLNGADEDISRTLKGQPSGTSLHIIRKDGRPAYELTMPMVSA